MASEQVYQSILHQLSLFSVENLLKIDNYLKELSEETRKIKQENKKKYGTCRCME